MDSFRFSLDYLGYLGKAAEAPTVCAHTDGAEMYRSREPRGIFTANTAIQNILWLE